MNILIIISSLSYGGAEKQAVADANMLCFKNNVFVLTFNNGPLKEHLNGGIPITILKKKGYLRTALRIARIIHREHISIVHAHLYAPMVMAAIAGKIAGIPVIWNFHSHAYEKSGMGKLIHKYAAKLNSVKQILFPAKELYNYYQSEGYKLNSSKAQILHNSGQAMNSPVEKPHKQKKSLLTIGYIGRLVKLKRVHLLIDLAEYLVLNEVDQFIIQIIGDGPEKKKLMNLCDRKGVTDKIQFFGFQENTQVHYHRFDLFALPSREEVLSLSLIDAGLAGLPAVAFNIGGNEEIINDTKTGYLANTTMEFFQYNLNLLKNETLRNEIGTNARNKCFSEFSPEIRLKNLTKLYEKYI